MTEKQYFIPSGSPYIKQYEKVLDHVAQENRGLTLNVNPDIVHEGNTDLAAILMAVAQHKAEWINGLMFGINFNFIKLQDTNSYFSVLEWANMPEYRAWLSKMGSSLPMAMFFLKDWEARFYSITGNLVNEKKTELLTDEEGQAGIAFSPEQFEIIHQRVGEGCQLFIDYCYGTGFDARPAIETILHEFQVKFDYEKVEEVFLKNLSEGVHYSMNF
jgi:hypothetical protein